MSNRKKKEPVAKKHKNLKTKEANESGNIEEPLSEEISSESIEPQEAEEIEEDILESLHFAVFLAVAF